MSESSDLPRRSRSYDPLSPTQTGSEQSRRDYSSADRHSLSEPHRAGTNQPSGIRDNAPQRVRSLSPVTQRQRGNIWQVLFGQSSKRPRQRTTRQQTKQQDFKTVKLDSRQNFLERLKPSERSRLTSDQAPTKLAAEQMRQAVLRRSQQFNGSSASPTPASLRGKPLHNRQPNSRQESLPLRSSSRAIPAFQSSPQTQGREQPTALEPQRRRQRTRRGLFAQRNHGLSKVESTQLLDSRAQAHTATRKRESQARPRSRTVSAGLYAARMLILSIGIGVLVGTMLSVLDPAARLTAGASQQAAKKADTVEGVNDSTKATQAAALSQSDLPAETVTATPLPKMGEELTALKASLQALALQNPKLTPGIFLFDLDTNAYLDLNGGASFAAASTIKVPVLVAFFQDVDAGKIRLDELLTMQKELVAGGSGELQGLPVGTQLTALETVTKMIIISDNTATNMVIARLGGMAALNQRFRSWGLFSTTINSMLPDLNGTNTTSPKELTLLMTRISQGELVSMRSRDRLLDIMERTVNRSQLPQGLGKGARIAHKTGDIGGLIGDVGLIDMPNGKRYSLTVLVKRSFNDTSAYDLVENASRTVYRYLNRVLTAPSRPAVEPATSAEPSLPRADNGVPADRAPSFPVDPTSTQSPSLDTATR